VRADLAFGTAEAMATNQVIDWQRKEVAESVGLFAATPRILRFAPDRRVRVVQNRCAILSNPRKEPLKSRVYWKTRE